MMGDIEIRDNFGRKIGSLHEGYSPPPPVHIQGRFHKDGSFSGVATSGYGGGGGSCIGAAIFMILMAGALFALLRWSGSGVQNADNQVNRPAETPASRSQPSGNRERHTVAPETNSEPVSEPPVAEEPKPEPPKDGELSDLRAHIRIHQLISGVHFVTVGVEGSVIAGGQTWKFYLRAHNVCPGDKVEYPAAAALLGRKQFSAVKVDLDVYDKNGTRQSLERRTELQGIRIDTGLSVSAVSRDGKIITLDTSGKTFEIPFDGKTSEWVSFSR